MTKIMPGAEPFEFTGSGASILLLHGLTGTPQSMRQLGTDLHHLTGYHVVCPLLPGHGTSVDDLEKTGHLDWLAAAEDALGVLATRQEPVFVCGQSMGGMLSLGLAALFPEKVNGVIPINGIAGIHYAHAANKLLRDRTSSRISGIVSDINRAGAVELAYDALPLSCLREVFLAQAAIGTILHQISSPCLIIQSLEDHVVDPKNCDFIASRISSNRKQILRLENSYHIATLDNDLDLMVQNIARLIEECT